MSQIAKSLCLGLKNVVKTPQLTFVRFRYHADKIAEGPRIRRFGYKEVIYQGGLLPRSKDFDRIRQMPLFRPKNNWAEVKALFGQNDYIDILGNEKLHPTRILYHIPSWLRGVGGIEYQVLLRKRKMLYPGITPTEQPTNWYNLQKRIEYLYKTLNRKRKTYFNMK